MVDTDYTDIVGVAVVHRPSLTLEVKSKRGKVLRLGPWPRANKERLEARLTALVATIEAARVTRTA